MNILVLHRDPRQFHHSLRFALSAIAAAHEVSFQLASALQFQFQLANYVEPENEVRPLSSDPDPSHYNGNDRDESATDHSVERGSHVRFAIVPFEIIPSD